MKVTLGMLVRGDCGVGKVIAMTKTWCIYVDGVEIAEPWEYIHIVAEAPDEPVSSIAEKVVE